MDDTKKMYIIIKEDAAQIYGRSFTGQSIPSHKWLETLGKIQGMTLEVETDHLFLDQYNTVPIEGISELGLRVMQESVNEVINDARVGKMKCRWCGKTQLIDVRCEHCKKSEYLESLVKGVKLFHSQMVVTAGSMISSLIAIAKEKDVDLTGLTVVNWGSFLDEKFNDGGEIRCEQFSDLANNYADLFGEFGSDTWMAKRGEAINEAVKVLAMRYEIKVRPGMGNALYDCTVCLKEVEEKDMASGNPPERIGICDDCAKEL